MLSLRTQAHRGEGLVQLAQDVTGRRAAVQAAVGVISLLDQLGLLVADPAASLWLQV